MIDFEAVYAKHWRLVRGVAELTANNSADAEDAAQLVWLAVWQKGHLLKHPEFIRTWLYRMAVNTTLNCRRQSRRTPPAWALPPLETWDAQNMADAEQAERNLRVDRSLIDAVLGELTPLESRTLRDHYLEGKSLKQLMSQEQASEGTIKRRLHDARQKASGVDINARKRVKR